MLRLLGLKHGLELDLKLHAGFIQFRWCP